MTREEFISKNRIDSVLSGRGISVIGQGKQRMAKCPLHEDKQASFSINHDEQTWFCHAGCGGGSVIDLLAKLENKSAVQILKESGVEKNGHSAPPIAPVIEKIYQYHDELGREVYQAVRLKPKSFRQRHAVDGKWVWSMEGVTRVLYHLPEIQKANMIWIVEGEKDADNLAALGYCATCNVGGAGKWLDAYTESLTGKDVVLCGDNDAPGQKHVEMVFESITGRVKTARIVKIPAPYKDASDFIAAAKDAKSELDALASDATQFVRGIRLPIFSLAEIEPRYRRQIRETSNASLDLGKWLPAFNKIRPLMPGEVVCFLADTGVGKSAILQNIAATTRLPTLFFEAELPMELLFERFIAIQTGMECQEVERAYRTTDDELGESGLQKLAHISICGESKLTPDIIESLIVRSELKTGVKPVLVLIDYIQLIGGIGNRRERVSDAAEQLKVIAKTTKTIIVVASQVARKEGETPGVGLHDGKESGSIENSAGLVIGVWRDEEQERLMHLSVLKNTKGKGSGRISVECIFDGAKMRIIERSKFTEEDVPKPYKD